LVKGAFRQITKDFLLVFNFNCIVSLEILPFVYNFRSCMTANELEHSLVSHVTVFIIIVISN